MGFVSAWIDADGVSSSGIMRINRRPHQAGICAATMIHLASERWLERVIGQTRFDRLARIITRCDQQPCQSTRGRRIFRQRRLDRAAMLNQLARLKKTRCVCLASTRWLFSVLPTTKTQERENASNGVLATAELRQPR